MKLKMLKVVMLIVLSTAISFAAAGGYVVEAITDEVVCVGQIRMIAFNFIPTGWVECNGDLYLTDELPELFSVLGNKFGGDGTDTFAVPNLQSPYQGVKYCIATTGNIPEQSEPLGINCFLGQIELFPYGYTPVGWAACEGQTMKIIDYMQLFSLLGTKFGGNGATNFLLPDLRGAEPDNDVKYYIYIGSDGTFPSSSNNYSNSSHSMTGSINLHLKSDYAGGGGECNGTLLYTADYADLYSCIGTTYGQNGSTVFGKPDLRGFTPNPELAYYIQTSGYLPTND